MRRAWPRGVVLALLLAARPGAGQTPPPAPPVAEEPTEASEPADSAPTMPAVGPPAGATAVQREAWLVAEIGRALALHPELALAKVGVAVMDVTSGKLLVARRANDELNIASNVKLATSAAALATLGPEYRWRTTLYADTPAWDGTSDTIRGNIFLRGGGDPTLDDAGLEALASAIARLGVRRIEGALVIDDGFFDGNLTPPAFDQKKEDAAFRAPVSAASLNYNAVALMIQPGMSSGTPVRVSVVPASDYIEVVNQAVTVAGGRTRFLVTTKGVPGKPSKLSVTVSGTLRLGDEPRWVRKRVEDPTEFLGSTFRAALERRGIKLRDRRIGRGATPLTARALHARQSEPLAVVIQQLNKWSNNFVAETILKTLAAERVAQPGTWQGGVQIVSAWLTEAGLGTGGWRLENGSGLYDSNRFSAAQIVTLLRAAALDYRIAPDYMASLAISGADGTIRSRMIGSPAERLIRAKTGTLNKVSCLAGYASGRAAAVAAGRGPLAFAVLVNDIPERVTGAGKAARALQDEIAQALVLYLDAPAK